MLANLVRRSNETGQQAFYDLSGRLLAVGQYRKGRPYGLWSYYEGGHLALVGRYDATGLRDSIWTTYRQESGQIERQEGYVDGPRTPWEKSFFDGKTLASECYPVPGTNLWEEKLYFWSGRLRVKMTKGARRKAECGSMQEGLLNGPLEEYYENGKLKETGMYYNGLPTGVHRFYSERGNLLRTEVGKKL